MAPSKTFFNHYKTLHLGRKATSSDIKKAYRELSLQAHPDKHPEYQGEYWTTIQKQINAAKDVLLDNQHRATYERLWTRELRIYFASGWEKKPPKAYNPPKPPKPPHVIRAEKATAKIDHLLYRYRKHMAAIEAENLRLFEVNVKLQKMIEQSKARKSVDESVFAIYLLENRKTPLLHGGDRLRGTFSTEERALFDKEARKAGRCVS